MMCDSIYLSKNEPNIGKQGSQISCVCLPPLNGLVHPCGCGLQARAAPPADVERVADGQTQATPDGPGRLKKLPPCPQSEAGL